MELNTTTFLHFCRVLDRVNSALTDDIRIKLLKDYFSNLNDRSLEFSVQFLVDGAFSSQCGKKIKLGSRSISVAASEFCEIDYELVFKPCRQVCASLSETIAVLITNTKAPEPKENVQLEDVFEIFIRLGEAKNAASKKRILKTFWEKLQPEEFYYFNELVLNKSILKTAEETVVRAIGASFHQNPKEIWNSFLKTGNLAETAVLAKNDNLNESATQFFHPVSLMPVKKMNRSEISEYQDLIVEKRIPGIRCQIHVKNQRVKILSDDAENIEEICADLITEFRAKQLPAVILEGTVCFCDENNSISKTADFFNNKNFTQHIPHLTPNFIAHDILHLNGKSLFEQSLLNRKSMLLKLASEFRLNVGNFYRVRDADQFESLYQSVLKSETELILKNAFSTYQPHETDNHWIHLKKPPKEIRALLLYAHYKNGWSSTSFFTDFTLGISVSNDDQFEEDFIPIGKTSARSLKNKELHAEIKKHSFERFGPTLAIKPQFLVELEYENVKINRRTKAGVSLQNPVLKQIYSSSEIEDLHSLEDVLKDLESEQQADFTLEMAEFIHRGEKHHST